MTQTLTRTNASQQGGAQPSRFEPVPASVSFPDMEEAILKLWQDNEIFQRSMREREGGPEYVFFEGPPTANGRPGIHHVLARAFKDMFPRYKTMQGYHVLRKGGWDTHGLPVELEVEKQLGLTGKDQIEEYGVAKFNQMCKESVWEYLSDWEALTERMAFWVSLDDAYVTMNNDYVQSLWWILQQLWNKDLLYEGYKVVPYCPRCGTPLSSHELSLGYQEGTVDPSIYVKFAVKNEDNTFLLAWTTTPWTLPGNAALAVGEKIDYVKVRVKPPPDSTTGNNGGRGLNSSGAQIYLAKELAATVLEPGYEILDEMKGAALVGKEYEPLFRFGQPPAERITLTSLPPNSSAQTTAPASFTLPPPLALTTWPSGRRTICRSSIRSIPPGSSKPEVTPSGPVFSSRTPTRASPLIWMGAGCSTRPEPTNTPTRFAGVATHP